jgi:MFS family permease
VFFTVSAIYLTQSVGLGPAQVGIGLTVAGLCGLLAGVPAGHLGDVRGPRNILVGLAFAEAVRVAAYTLVHSFGAFLLVACLVTTVDRASNALCITWGWPGWLAVGAVFAVAGTALVPLVRRAEHRPLPAAPDLHDDPLLTR